MTLRNAFDRKQNLSMLSVHGKSDKSQINWAILIKPGKANPVSFKVPVDLGFYKKYKCTVGV